MLKSHKMKIYFLIDCLVLLYFFSLNLKSINNNVCPFFFFLQDIFECRTCGLTGSLCCCTECARVCHKGHDCKLKRTSPTAYCDCWEKCKCKALIQGHQGARFDLLCRLIADTDLVSKHNSRYNYN